MNSLKLLEYNNRVVRQVELEDGVPRYVVTDVLYTQIDSSDISAYWRKLKQRMGPYVHRLELRRTQVPSFDGETHLMDIADRNSILLILDRIKGNEKREFITWFLAVTSDRTEPNAAEWQKINEIAMGIHSASNDLEARRFLLDRIYELVPYDMISSVLCSSDKNDVEFFSPTGISKIDHVSDERIEEILGEYNMIYKNSDPYLCSFYKDSEDTVCIDSEFCLDSTQGDSIFYTDSLWKFGLFFFMTTKNVRDDLLLGSIVISRGKDLGDFTPLEKEIVRILNEHLSEKLRQFFPLGVTEEMLSKENSPLVTIFNLTRREFEIAEELLKDKTAEQIGKELGLSPSTVRGHLRNVYKKTNVHGRKDFMEMARMLRIN